MLLHKYSIKESVWSSNRFRYQPVCAVSRLSLRQRSSVATQQWWLTVVKLFGGGVDRKMATLGSMCVCVCMYSTCVCEKEAACVDLMCECVCLLTSSRLLQYLCCPPTHCAPTKAADLIGFPSAFGVTHTVAQCEAVLLLTPVKPRLLMSHLLYLQINFYKHRATCSKSAPWHATNNVISFYSMNYMIFRCQASLSKCYSD